MQPNPSEGGSSASSGDLFDLDLPEVGEGEAPLPLGEVSYEQARAHAILLIRSGLVAPTARPAPSPEPFRMD